MPTSPRSSAMLLTALKFAVVMATSVVAVPYSIALLANILYGWPRPPNKFRKALNPRKVLALNQAVLQQLTNLRFTRLYFKWQHFYTTAPNEILVKDLAYGRHENRLDVYMPPTMFTRRSGRAFNPTIVFVYGGAWGSGDKNMYGLLCTQLANRMNATVVCPNYSIYPKGYVDDMIQDIVDCVSWVHQDGHLYGADKTSIMLVGHSAGAHLCMMSVLELTLQKLLRQGTPAMLAQQPIIFDEHHFTPPSSLHESGPASDSFVYVDDSAVEGAIQGGNVMIDGPEKKVDLLTSIRAVVGLSGVYDITDHYQHESYRGIEDLSTMCKAMYGPEHFQRFSPSHVITQIPNDVSLPPVRLLHGSADVTVPTTSTHKMHSALSTHGVNVSTTVIENCGHVDVCIDIMEEDRKHYEQITQIICAVAQQHLTRSNIPHS